VDYAQLLDDELAAAFAGVFIEVLERYHDASDAEIPVSLRAAAANVDAVAKRLGCEILIVPRVTTKNGDADGAVASIRAELQKIAARLAAM